MAEARPVPVPDAVSAPFWAAAREQRLVVQHCLRCDRLQHPPGPICKRCASTEIDFVEVSGRGTVYSFTVSHQPFVPGFGAEPLAIVLVELSEQEGVRLLGNVVGAPPDALTVGMPVRVVFETLEDGTVLPQFTPDEA